MRRRVLHIISGLDTGGAEMMLYKILAYSENYDVDYLVISIRKPGPIATKIRDLGFEVQTLNIGASFWHVCISLPLLISKTIRFRPDVIQGWMYHGNLFAMISAFFFPKKVMLFWNVRQSLYDIKKEKLFTRLTIWICKIFSKMPARILYNSILSAQQHEKYGFFSNQRMIIFNGFEIEKFKRSQQTKVSIKRELNVNTKYIVGHIGRFHPKKDHKTMFLVAKKLLEELNDVTFIFVGRDILPSNRVLAGYMDDSHMGETVKLLGERTDIERILTAMDVLVSTSGWGEGFSNVIGEAMSAGVLCVATNVGDSKNIIGETGAIVRPHSIDQISMEVAKILHLSDEQRLTRGKEARRRIIEYYSIEKITKKYLTLYQVEEM